jgi:hypothetical protein
VNNSDYELRTYSQTEIDSIIENHPYTVIFAWSLACGVCGMQLTREVNPFYKNKPDSIGFISITCSNYDEVEEWMKKSDCIVPTYILCKDSTCRSCNLQESCELFDEWFGKMFKNYEPETGMPRYILCNNKREIFNVYSDGEIGYGQMSYCIAVLKERNK